MEGPQGAVLHVDLHVLPGLIQDDNRRFTSSALPGVESTTTARACASDTRFRSPSSSGFPFLVTNREDPQMDERVSGTSCARLKR